MIIKDVSPKGITSVVVNGRINKAKASLDKLGFEIISAEENAGLRIERGKDSYVSSNHNCVKEGFVYVPGKGGFVTRQSLVQLYPNEAMKDRFCGEVPAGEFQVTDEQAEEVLEDSIKVPLNDVMVPTERLGENELACYLFGKQVDDYGNFLKDAGKDETYISIMNEEKRIRANRSTKPFARDLWFYGIKTSWGGILTKQVERIAGITLRGIKDTYDERVLPLGDLYSPGEIRRALGKMEMSGLEEQLIKTLGKWK